MSGCGQSHDQVCLLRLEVDMVSVLESELEQKLENMLKACIC